MGITKNTIQIEQSVIKMDSTLYKKPKIFCLIQMLAEQISQYAGGTSSFDKWISKLCSLMATDTNGLNDAFLLSLANIALQVAINLDAREAIIRILLSDTNEPIYQH